MRLSSLFFIIIFIISFVNGWKVREVSANDPVADPKAIVLFGNARFTVLTSQLIRLEYADNGVFVDSASLTFINRKLAVPSFTTKQNGDVLVINTNDLVLVYNKGLDAGAFSAGNLNITFGQVNWYPGLNNTGNLLGTRSSLDCYEDSCQDGMPLGQGLISTLGWNVFDDSAVPLFNYTNTDGIPWITSDKQRNGGTAKTAYDWYFFGYGYDYTQLLYDYSTLSGPIAIPPVSAFGTWWSRYYPYNQTTIIDQVIDGYKNNSLPLNHLVLDMDWHIEVKDKQCSTWGGYTWNTEFFPDPSSFIEYLHNPPNNLRLLLNVHPQTGVDVCQAKYQDLATAIDFDATKNTTIPCDFTNHELATNMFSVVMDPVGADYWWTDYSGCQASENINSEYDLLWSNHVYFYAHATKNQRPLTLSRFGGAGNQRYPIGFSGDTYDVFPTLQFEIYFTHTAANILFGYWSHDTGGFHNEPSDELFLRWLQFAAVEPIFRIHSDHQERRIWVFPSFELMKETMLLRNSFGPYIYSQARRAYDTAIAIVHPLYYDFPQSPEAYSYVYQYKFGEDLLAAPIVTPVDPETNTTYKPIWIPPGAWVQYFSLEVINGPKEINLTVGLADIPLYARAGAIIPLKTMDSVTNYTPDPLQFAIFPGAVQGNTTYYEDDGSTQDYLNGAFSTNQVSYSVQGSTYKVIIGATTGTFQGQPTSRNYQTILKGINTKPSTVTVNGNPLGPSSGNGSGWWVDSTLNGLVVQPPTVALSSNADTVIVIVL